MSILLAILANDQVQLALLGMFIAAAGATARYIIGFLRDVKKRLLHELDAAQLELIRGLAAEAVEYAEQVYKDQNGDARLAAAMVAADKMILSYGIHITTEQLRTIIEAAVYTELAKPDTTTTTTASMPDTTTTTTTTGGI